MILHSPTLQSARHGPAAPPPRGGGTQPGGVEAALEREQIERILSEVHLRHGVDLRHYAYSTIRRRLWRMVRAEGLAGLDELCGRLARDRAAGRRLRASMSIMVTAMFRDPSFFRAFREHVVPPLRALRSFRVWHAGCATGEEVYSMAILLEEEGLLDRARILATDMNEAALHQAVRARLPRAKLEPYAENHLAAGGKRPLAHYLRWTSAGPSVCSTLLAHVTFACHDLVAGPPLREVDLVVCRNVVIYFDRELQERVFQGFDRALRMHGFLGMGSRESLRLGKMADRYKRVGGRQRLYQKRT